MILPHDKCPFCKGKLKLVDIACYICPQKCYKIWTYNEKIYYWEIKTGSYVICCFAKNNVCRIFNDAKEVTLFPIILPEFDYASLNNVKNHIDIILAFI